MSDPVDRQAATLAELDRQIEIARACVEYRVNGGKLGFCPDWPNASAGLEVGDA